jgi:hypothetical protein
MISARSTYDGAEMTAGTFSDRYVWAPLYDAAAKCGKPRGAATNRSHVLAREFEGCRVTLNCSNASACVGQVTYP